MQRLPQHTFLVKEGKQSDLSLEVVNQLQRAVSGPGKGASCTILRTWNYIARRWRAHIYEGCICHLINDEGEKTIRVELDHENYYESSTYKGFLDAETMVSTLYGQNYEGRRYDKAAMTWINDPF